MSTLKYSIVVLLSIVTQKVNSWTWNCDTDNYYCTRTNNGKYQSIEECRLVCGHYGGIWPQPTPEISLDTNLVIFNPSINFLIYADTKLNKYLDEVAQIFQHNLKLNDPKNCNSETEMTINISVTRDVLDLNWNTIENYQLDIQTVASSIKVNVRSETVFGARHALETLSQLVVGHEISESNSVCLTTVKSAHILDGPVFRHRGLLLDCSRNYVPVDNIKIHIDGMAASKLNYMHWHVTDSQSWPLEIETLPNMTKYGAYTPDGIYTKQDVLDLRQYALLRGVQILIEIDAPSHSGNGWNWGPSAGLGNLAVCVNQEQWRSYCIEPPCGQLNPANEKLYDTLETLYKFINDNYPNDVFHMGGDELFIPCWNTTDEIIKYLDGKPRTTETFLELWSEYQEKALNRFDKTKGHTNTPIIVWTSHLTDPSIITNYLPKSRYVIQSWVPSTDDLPNKLEELGYYLIISTKDAWYLDHGFWGTTKFYDWKTVYDNEILNSDKVLGGEVCMWGEFVEYTSMEPRVWPRASAASERLWSNPTLSSNNATVRFYRQRERLVKRGINADAVGPRWCYQNEGTC